ncbi:transcriptional regulator [Streptomyces antioxidans]|uniref:Transcriptional regulator n=1 Tax=Streptomyces antioxidans TaxID=1507734 RepID=A0A1V4CUI0_9ACTN|nr:helix-turn-helix domain-containing protein [Streptomyces antioxidans]OPF70500.1 transcriptional regulator [Streptomyces antioxidans]
MSEPARTSRPAPTAPDGFIADCRARLGFDLLARTWTGVVIIGLREGPRRPGQLREAIGGISPKVLNDTLRRLEDDGLVERHRYAEAPPRVEYGLTPLGETLLGPMKALGAWSMEYGDAVVEAQERAERRRERGQ